MQFHAALSPFPDRVEPGLDHHLDEDHFEPAMNEVLLGSLQADEPAPTTTARVLGFAVWKPE